jgi:hypothetical protein
VTVIGVPFTEITAEVGVGDVPGDPETPEPEPDPDPPEPDVPAPPDPLELDVDPDPVEDVSLCTCCENGSLLSNRLKEASRPSVAPPDELVISPEPVVAVLVAVDPAGVVPVPWSSVVGASSEGVVVGVETVCGTAAALALPRCICFITRGTWNASSPSRRTPPTPAMIFCFFSFALRSFFFGI